MIERSSSATRLAPLAGWEILSSRRRAPAQPLRDRLRAAEAELEVALGRARELVARRRHVPAATEWLLDNAYVIRRTVRLCRTDLGRRRERRLPRLAAGELRGQPRVYALARELLRGAEVALDEDELREAVAGFRGRPTLSTGELWALPVTLRLVVLERLAECGAARPAGVTEAGRAAPARPADVDEAHVRDGLRALHTLEKLDWKRFFEATSPVERILSQDPARVYDAMEFATRDSYRQAVEEIARGSGLSEEVVAARAVDASQRAEPGSLAAHVGVHLVGSERRAFEQATGARARASVRARRAVLAHPALCYLASTGAIVALLEAITVHLLATAGAGPGLIAAAALLALVPAVTVAVALTNWLVTSLLAPRVLPKMSYETGLPRRCRTLVAVPCLLSNAGEIDSLLERLEVRYLGNDDPAIGFALLSDLPDADEETSPADAVLERAAADGIEALNRRHERDGSRPFHLLHRRRLFNGSEGRWMGWERKRGKLEELNRLLLDGSAAETSFSLRVGDADFLRDVRFVISLDADTQLPPGSARRMTATLDHPLNRAVVDPASGRVVAGYTVIQPRVEVAPGGEWSLFAHLFSGDTVLDLYSRAVSDAYHDLFGEGTFVGKGIYEVRSFERSLRGRVPRDALLSHDLFEGLHGRAGLASDIVVLEGYPRHYLAFMRRLHRWVRGDWQLLPWLGRSVPTTSGERAPNRLTAFARWRVADNLRRSLLAPSLFAFLALSWAVLPVPAILTAGALLALALPALTGFTGGILRNARSARLGPLMDPIRELPRQLAQWLLRVVFLPHEAAVCADAAGRTLFRVYVSRRRLLQWTPAAESERAIAAERRLLPVWIEMRSAPLLASALAIVLAVARPEALAWTAPLLLAWAGSPLVAAFVSRPERAVPYVPDEASRRRLRLLARRTWLYFEQFTGPEDQWLPPDNVQQEPGPVIAHRTSPTNVGMLLASCVAALDLGYVGPRGMAVRLRNALDSLRRLERYQGHPLNWYDTRTLEPLEPRYVSTVDNGNLAACLIVVERACIEVLDAPLRPAPLFAGLVDTIALCAQSLEAIVEPSSAPSQEAVRAAVRAARAEVAILERDAARAAADPAGWSRAARDLLERAAELALALEPLVAAAPGGAAAGVDEAVMWGGLVRRHLDVMATELATGRPWLEPLPVPAALRRLAGDDRAVRAALDALVASLEAAPPARESAGACRRALARVRALETALGSGAGAAREGSAGETTAWIAGVRERLAAAEREADVLLADLESCLEASRAALGDMDFGLLYDETRHLFHIGFRVAEERPDPNHYDLLASEARLTSFLALARGEVPEPHWLHLGRPLARAGGALVLLSWSGTLFEYLMPTLFMRQAAGALLDRTCRVAVREQVRYARRRGIPWGISESGYFHFDAQQNYQYRAFGVPTLGFKRGLGDDVVVAPYACLLALGHAPREVDRNLDRLERLGLEGRFGLHEAADLTPARLEAGERVAVVRSYMAHHQGMILLGIDNHLEADAIVRRFHASPLVRTTERLLHEGEPRHAPIERPRADDGRGAPRPRPTAAPWRAPSEAPAPLAHAVSNGRMTSVLTSAGGGYCAWREVGITAFRADPTLDDDGLRVYVREDDDGRLWTVGRSPSSADDLEVTFHAHKVEVHHREGELAAALSLVVPPDDDVEIRRLHLTNRGDRARRVTVCSYAEVMLGDPGECLRHPAFARLFVESRFDAALGGLVFSRRARSPEEPPVLMLHRLLLPGGARARGHETARDRFIGRGRTPRSPLALDRADRAPGVRAGPGRVGPGPAGAADARFTLDPVMALRATLDLPRRRSVELAFITIAGRSEADLVAAAGRYNTLAALDRADDEARLRSDAALRDLDVDAARLPLYQRLLSLLLYSHRALRPPAPVLAGNRLGASRLWGHAISGDLPILLLRVGGAGGAGGAGGTALLAELLAAHELWRTQRIRVDLVVLNEQESTYDSSVTDAVHRAIGRAGVRHRLNRRGGVFVLQGARLPEEERTLLFAAARVVLDAEGASLEQQIEATQAGEPPLPVFFPVRSSEPDPTPTPRLERPRDLLFDNGLGGFSPDGREYVIHIEGGRLPPAPWANVVTNGAIGFLATEGGSGYTWAGNAALDRITPWANDPVTDPPPEAVYLRDEETAEVWSPTPLPAGGPEPYQVRHGAGHTTYIHHSHQLKQRLELFVAAADPVKVHRLEIENTAATPRRLTVTLVAEWILGVDRRVDGPHVIPELDVENEVLLARNPWNEPFAGRVTFLAASAGLNGLTADRTELFGQGGDRARPDALSRVGLRGTVAAGRDPCGALQVHVDLPARGRARLHFLLGQAGSREEALALARRYRDADAVERARAEGGRGWDEVLGAVTVKTPDPALDLLVNRWLLYQTLASRLWGRTGLYQSSGAFGFRDQLQDALALVHARPAILRERILDAAAHQFREGDVLHWWHQDTRRGLRSRCSDDLLWLPYATAHYVRATGDRAILDEEVPFLAGDPLRADERERYGEFVPLGEAGGSATLYRHCLAAIERGSTAGARGLPLFGTGDWNDGMNRVGEAGRGESVWLGWFLHVVLTAFASLVEEAPERETADATDAFDAADAADVAVRLRARAAALGRAIEERGWDGEWYARGFYDDGAPLGSARSEECRVDLIAQAWAVLSGAGDPSRAREAVEQAWRQLVRPDDGLVLLLTPPFDRTEQDPGYIKGYAPGVRENGGQYTHAATWLGWAFAMLGDGDRAHAVFRLVNPIRHGEPRASKQASDQPGGAVSIYRVEPYVVAADVYAVPPHVGRGGWTWYTGSAAWLYRLAVEAILGLRREGGDLRLVPCLPRAWAGYEATVRHGAASYRIRVENGGSGRDVIEARCDGALLEDALVPLRDDGREHEVVLRLA